MTSNKKWYELKTVIIMLLIFLFPVGLFLMWKYAGWNKAIKIIISIVIGIIVIALLINPSSQQSTNQTTQQTKRTKETKQEQEQPASPYSYVWSEETTNTYWLLLKGFHNTAPDFKDRIKATIADFQNKTSFTTNTLVSLTDSSDVYGCETLAGKPGYTIQKYIACLDQAGGKNAYNTEESVHNIALYNHDFKYNADASECTNKCNELIFYPDASSESNVGRYKETLYWKP